MTEKCKAHHLFLKLWQKEECTVPLWRETWSIQCSVAHSAELTVNSNNKNLVLKVQFHKVLLLAHTVHRSMQVTSAGNQVFIRQLRTQMVKSGRHHQQQRTLWIQQLSVPNEQKIFLELCTSPSRQTEVNKQQPRVYSGGWNVKNIPAAQDSSLSKTFFWLSPMGIHSPCLCDDNTTLIILICRPWISNTTETS